MKLAINAFNIRVGGGVTHLVELLSAANPPVYGFNEVSVWAPSHTLEKLPNRKWLIKISVPSLEKNWFRKIYWNLITFNKEIKKYDLLYVPGGTYLGGFTPFISFFQNVLPFESREIKKYLFLDFFLYLKRHLLRITQGITLKKCSAAIFPSYYAKNLIIQSVKTNKSSIVIPHGINPSFMKEKSTGDLRAINSSRTIRVLYVSTVDIYKNQWNVVKAMKLLRNHGVNLSLDLIGGVVGKKAIKFLKKEMSHSDPGNEFVSYLGPLNYEKLPLCYKEADIFVFASSCESISSILMEAMAAGLCIVCSNQSAMQEILKDAGIYCNPENPEDIAYVVSRFLEMDESEKNNFREKAMRYASEYTWGRCAEKTVSFLSNIAKLKYQKQS